MTPTGLPCLAASRPALVPAWDRPGRTARRAAAVLLGLVFLLGPPGTAQDPSTSGRDRGSERAEGRAEVKVPLAGAEKTVPLVRNEEGALVFEVRRRDGTVETLFPDQFAERVWQEQLRRGWWLRLLNITSPVGMAWVALGLLGQVLFAGRMILQWLISEREQRSVVPVGFWWMSLMGATLLVIYFVWRQDVVGVLGQATGWTVYGRNLWLIYVTERRRPSVGEATPSATDP